VTCIRPLPVIDNFKLVIVDHFGTMPISTGTGYSIPKQPQPYHGHYFKVLKGQVPATPLGQMDFVVKGAMIGRFALAAVAAEYRVTGVQALIVGPSGVVYQKGLRADTLKAFQA